MAFVFHLGNCELNCTLSLLQGVSVKKSTLVLTIQKQHSSVSNSMIILLQMETGRRETVRLTRRRKAKLL